MSAFQQKRESIDEVKADAERKTLERLAPYLARKKAAEQRQNAIDAIPEAEIVVDAPKKKK